MWSWARAVLLLQKQATTFLPVHVYHHRTAAAHSPELGGGTRACCLHLAFVETATFPGAEGSLQVPTEHWPPYNFCIKLYLFPPTLIFLKKSERRGKTLTK